MGVLAARGIAADPPLSLAWRSAPASFGRSVCGREQRLECRWRDHWWLLICPLEQVSVTGDDEVRMMRPRERNEIVVIAIACRDNHLVWIVNEIDRGAKRFDKPLSEPKVDPSPQPLPTGQHLVDLGQQASGT